MTGFHLLHETNSWAFVSVTNEGRIHTINQKAIEYFERLEVGKYIKEVFPWFKEEWLYETDSSRVVKLYRDTRMLMHVLPGGEGEQAIFLFKKADEYKNVNHLWCEVEDSLIRLQLFLDNSHDGIVLTSGKGVIKATNKAFCAISGLNEEQIVGRNVYDLYEEGFTPLKSIINVLEGKASDSTVARFPHGKETAVSSNPLFDKSDNIVRVLSNVRDITELEALHNKIRSAEALAKHYQRAFKAREATERLDRGLHRSRKMDELYELVNKVADTNLPLLVTGESGVGKTELAKFVHDLSERKETGAFVHINCSAIPDALLESELFGYEAGAFSGASKTKVGLFEIAQKGTILLDEIGDMPLMLQAKLLNVLQEKRFYRIGGTRTIETDARVVAATNQNLSALIAEGRFRQDLFFRLNVIPVTIAPLRERREDITPLLLHVLKDLNARYDCHKTLSADTLDIMGKHDWPGNIRELKNLLERLVVLSHDDVIEPGHLPPELTRDRRPEPSRTHAAATASARHMADFLWNPGEPLKAAVNHFESMIIEQAISLYGTAKNAAKKLGVDESTITRKRSRSVKPTVQTRATMQ